MKEGQKLVSTSLIFTVLLPLEVGSTLQETKVSVYTLKFLRQHGLAQVGLPLPAFLILLVFNPHVLTCLYYGGRLRKNIILLVLFAPLLYLTDLLSIALIHEHGLGQK